ASDKLKQNTLTPVRHVEFCLSSCHVGSNESIHMGKDLVALLSNYMVQLHTIRLWRDDDFPWTSSKKIFSIKINIFEINCKSDAFIEIFCVFDYFGTMYSIR
ncbi:unnamed protein product, partial [Rotaria sp. Silwood1]